MSTLDLTCVQSYKHTHISGRFFYSTSSSAYIIYTHTPTHTHTHTHMHSSSCVLEIFLMIHTHTHTHTHAHADCLHKHIFLLHVYRSISLARMERYTQVAYLFQQRATSLLSRGCRIADCTVRHPGVERPFLSHICQVKSVFISTQSAFLSWSYIQVVL